MNDGDPTVEINILPILLKDQKERQQNLIKITVLDMVLDEHVDLYMQKVKGFVTILVLLSLLADEALLSLPTITYDEPGEQGDEQSRLGGNVLLATQLKTEDPENPYVTFSGSHRIFYATVDVCLVNGAAIHAFKEQLKSIAKFHKWIALVK